MRIDKGLLECDFGDWTGAELKKLYRLPEWNTVQRAPSTFTFPGGESFTAMQTRIVSAVDRIRAAHPGGVVVCVSHADPIKALVAHAMGTHIDLFQRIVISTCSITATVAQSGNLVAATSTASTLSMASNREGPVPQLPFFTERREANLSRVAGELRIEFGHDSEMQKLCRLTCVA